jgi:hypothetical protein
MVRVQVVASVSVAFAVLVVNVVVAKCQYHGRMAFIVAIKIENVTFLTLY